MLGYICPCCSELISISDPREVRTCPTCKAHPETQRIIQERRTSAGTPRALPSPEPGEVQ